MKTARIITSVLVMSVVLACSVFPVFAMGHVQKTTSASFQGPNVNYYASARATQYQGVGTAGNGTSSSAYVGQSAIVVTVSFFNQGDEPWYLNGVYVSLNDSTSASRNLTDFEIIGGNLSVTPTATPYIFSIFGGENNSYDGGFVVAPHSNLSVAFRVSAFATSDSGNPQFSLQSISFGNSSNSVGDYPYGLDVDFSPLIDYLNSDVVPEMLDQGLTLDDILYLLQQYPDALTPVVSGGYTAYGSNNTVSNGVSFIGQYTFNGVSYVDSDIEYSYQDSNVNRVYALNESVVLWIKNPNDFTVNIPRSLAAVLNCSVSSNYSYLGSVYDYSSDIFTPALVHLHQNEQSFNLRSLVSTSQINLAPGAVISVRFDVTHYYGSNTSDNITFTFGNGSFTFYGFSATEVDDDTVSDLNDIHDQEEQWYQDNEQAIESTGLANYQFTTSQISGLTAITTQFSQVWDALGDWNLVYIFTLLLSFATYILRHRPSTKSQQRVAASEEYRYSNFMHNLAWRNEIRARWKAQDARYDKGDSSGASDLMRRNIRR